MLWLFQCDFIFGEVITRCLLDVIIEPLLYDTHLGRVISQSIAYIDGSRAVII